MSLSDNELILTIVLPIFGIFFIALFAYIIYYCKCCSKKRKRFSEDTELLVSNDTYGYNGTTATIEDETSFMNKNDINLIEKVKIEKLKQLAESRETAYVFLQFFIRSNPQRIFKSIDHLQPIGKNQQRNWFIVKESITNANKLKMFQIDIFTSNKRLLQISDSMSLSRREMELLIRDLFIQIKHPNVLSCEVHLNFDKSRVLFIQDYSRDGSLRDTMYNLSPDNEWQLKLQKNTSSKNLFYIMSLKNFGKQILSGLIYFKHKMFPPMVNLHSGNIILAYNKRICLLTGYESCFFIDKLEINDDKLKKVLKTYLTKTDQNELRKAKQDIEIKRVLETLRFGNILIEMSLGIDLNDSLIPNDDIFKLIDKYQQVNKINNDFFEFMQFLYRNKTGIDKDNSKQKNKYILPSLNELIEHKFFSDVKFNDDDSAYFNQSLDPDHYELMQYINGTLKLKEKKRRKSTLNKNDFFSTFSTSKNTNLDTNRASLSTNLITSPQQQITESSQTTVQLPIAAAPPMPQMISAPPPPAPPPPPLSNLSSGPKPERQALLGDIRKGMSLKKTVTNDRSKPVF